MFCKWCGEKIDPAERECAACGREIPPLSDCGGFYGLTENNAQRRSAPIDTNACPPKQEAKRTTKSTRNRIKYRLASKALLVLVPLLLLALLINIQINIAKLTKQGERIVTALEDIKTEMVGEGTDEVDDESDSEGTSEGDDGSIGEVDGEGTDEVDGGSTAMNPTPPRRAALVTAKPETRNENAGTNDDKNDDTSNSNSTVKRSENDNDAADNAAKESPSVQENKSMRD